jgi:inorganic pyrophosphatase
MNPQVLKHLFQAHPWHGIAVGSAAPSVVNAYIEIVPTDVIKYEIDKASGHLRVDRPQKYSNCCPTLYGFIPQTYCGTSVGQFCASKLGRAQVLGDGDPLDICVLAERPIQHGAVLLEAIPIGGMRMVDGEEADDKIIAVLRADAVFGEWTSITQCPAAYIERLRHYFLTYKDLPGDSQRRVEISHVYDREEALEVIRRSCADYQESFQEISGAFRALSGE